MLLIHSLPVQVYYDNHYDIPVLPVQVNDISVLPVQVYNYNYNYNDTLLPTSFSVHVSACHLIIMMIYYQHMHYLYRCRCTDEKRPSYNASFALKSSQVETQSNRTWRITTDSFGCNNITTIIDSNKITKTISIITTIISIII